jgi:hypothetical protein
MRSLMIALLALLALAACKKPDRFDKAIAETKQFRDRICACADAACVNTAYAAYAAFLERTKQDAGDAKPSEAQDYRGRVAANELQTCRYRTLAGK